MEIRIGENIKRLRTRKGITQEQLSEVLHVSAVAVSKWERGETMPDITLLPKLAYYFQTTTDELLSYDACEVELRIAEFINKHTEAAEAGQYEACAELSREAYADFPNDYRIMELYMWDLIGGYADNDDAVITANAKTLSEICDRILNGCTDAFIRADAVVMKGKILKAGGHVEEALKLYKEELPDWYQTAGQKSEQLFKKDTKEFAVLLRRNIKELCRFVLNKKSKEFKFLTKGTAAAKREKAKKFCEVLWQMEPFFPEGDIEELITYFIDDYSRSDPAFR